ncbi:MAG: DUF1835 domain-containing protein [Chitinophagaceae bacterium]
MIHIVFEEANIEALQKAIELDETLQGEIVQIKDDFAVGPVTNIYETDGYQQRRDWWQNLLENSPYKEQIDLVDDKMAVHQLIKTLTEKTEEKVWIWMAQNQHDVCSYYWLMSQLKDYQGRVEVLYLNNLPFINEKGQIFYPTHLYEIQPKEFLKAKKLARIITSSEFEVDPDEWTRICTENAAIRFLEGGKKIVGKKADFFDKDLLSVITNDFQKLTKVLHNALGKMKIQTGDVFLVGRIKQLIEEQKLEAQGDWNKGWKEVEIKLLSNVAFNQEEN